MNTKAVTSSTSKAVRLELGTRILLFFGFFWILAGGGVALWIGIQQVLEGSVLHGAISIVLSIIVLFSAWFMRTAINR